MSRKRLHTRRRRALRRLVLAAVLLLLTNHLLGVGLLLPIQAVRQEGEHWGTGRTWTVERKRVPVLRQTHLFYLTENDRAVLLGDTYLSFLGWETMFGCAVDCTDPAPIHAGYHCIAGTEAEVGCYFGRIDDPAIETITISIQEETYDQGQAVRTELRRLTVEREEFLTRGERTFFWTFEAPAPERDPEQILCPVVIACDREGAVIAEFDIEQSTFSSFG